MNAFAVFKVSYSNAFYMARWPLHFVCLAPRVFIKVAGAHGERERAQGEGDMHHGLKLTIFSAHHQVRSMNFRD